MGRKSRLKKERRKLMNKLKANKSVVWPYIAVLGIAFFCYVFYWRTTTFIINYPDNIYYYLIPPFTVIAWLLNSLKNRMLKRESRSTLSLFSKTGLLWYIVLAFFIVGIVLVPLNYYIIYQSEGNYVEVHSVEIFDIYKVRGGKGGLWRGPYVSIFIDGAFEVRKNPPQLVDEIYRNKDSDQYYYQLDLRKGLFDMDIVVDERFVKKE